jgi:hypothetical protein
MRLCPRSAVATWRDVYFMYLDGDLRELACFWQQQWSVRDVLPNPKKCVIVPIHPSLVHGCFYNHS